MVNPLIDSIGTHFWENRYRSPAKIKNLTLAEENPRRKKTGQFSTNALLSLLWLSLAYQRSIATTIIAMTTAKIIGIFLKTKGI
jgi:hypothetical protein